LKEGECPGFCKSRGSTSSAHPSGTANWEGCGAVEKLQLNVEIYSHTASVRGPVDLVLPVWVWLPSSGAAPVREAHTYKPSGLWPDSSVRQLVGRGLLEGRGVSWLLQKQGLGLFSSPLGTANWEGCGAVEKLQLNFEIYSHAASVRGEFFSQKIF